jgi:hypothetical protein
MAMKPERATSAKVAEPSGGMCGFLAAKLPVRSLLENDKTARTREGPANWAAQ